MKILYISHLNGDGANGLSWSVPASVNAQSKYDNVYWLNTGSVVMAHWDKVHSFHNCQSVRFQLLKNLPQDFQYPDLAVFEGFYDSIIDVVWGLELKKKRIPYVIVPRSALTETALNNHARLKKIIAHHLFYNRFIKNAAAFHFLTSGEAQQTLSVYRKRNIIIPNGISLPCEQKIIFSKDRIITSFIGRIDVYQKGLDLLLSAIEKKRELLNNRGFHLNIYGPESSECPKLLKLCDKYLINNLITIKGPVFGEDKERVLLETDVFILTSRFEGLSMGLIEALSYGIPCAISEGTYMNNEVEKSEAGWTSDVSIDGISQMLENICKDQDRFGLIGENARLLSTKYDWDAIAQKTHNEYERILTLVKS